MYNLCHMKNKNLFPRDTIDCTSILNDKHMQGTTFLTLKIFFNDMLVNFCCNSSFTRGDNNPRLDFGVDSQSCN